MGDRTPLQITVYSCATAAERRAVLAQLDDLHPEWGDLPDSAPGWAVYDNARNTDGKWIRAGQDPLELGVFDNEDAAGRVRDEAAEQAGGDPDGDRFTIEECKLVALGEEYMDPQMSCGSSDEYAGNLVEAAPGCSFIMWEDPYGEWLGSVNMYTPELGLFSAECDGYGTVQLEAQGILKIVDDEDDKPAIRAALDKALGKPWLRAMGVQS